MMRYVVLVAVVCLVCRWALGRWPWEYLRGPSARTAALRRARSLLGVEAGASRDEVIAAAPEAGRACPSRPRRHHAGDAGTPMPRATCSWPNCPLRARVKAADPAPACIAGLTHLRSSRSPPP